MLMMIFPLFLAALSTPGLGIEFHNKVAGPPVVDCGQDKISIEVETTTPSESPSRIFAKGQSSKDACTFTTTKSATFSLSNCNMERQRNLSPRGLFYSITVVIQMHPLFITKVDRAYNIKCFYMEAEKTVTAAFDVSMIATETLDKGGAMPVCKYGIHRDTPNGPEVRYAQIGDKVHHVWECPSEGYGMLVHSCYVDDGQNNRIQILDANGCGMDQYVMKTPNYATDLTMAMQETHVFKFADRLAVKFQCQIKLCMKDQGSCDGVTPPKCPDNEGGTLTERITMTDSPPQNIDPVTQTLPVDATPDLPQQTPGPPPEEETEAPVAPTITEGAETESPETITPEAPIETDAPTEGPPETDSDGISIEPSETSESPVPTIETTESTPEDIGISASTESTDKLNQAVEAATETPIFPTEASESIDSTPTDAPTPPAPISVPTPDPTPGSPGAPPSEKPTTLNNEDTTGEGLIQTDATAAPSDVTSDQVEGSGEGVPTKNGALEVPFPTPYGFPSNNGGNVRRAVLSASRDDPIRALLHESDDPFNSKTYELDIANEMLVLEPDEAHRLPDSLRNKEHPPELSRRTNSGVPSRRGETRATLSRNTVCLSPAGFGVSVAAFILVLITCFVAFCVLCHHIRSRKTLPSRTPLHSTTQSYWDGVPNGPYKL